MYNTIKHLLVFATALGSVADQESYAQVTSLDDAKDALLYSPFDLENPDPHFQYLLKVVEHGSVHQKMALIAGVKDVGGSIEWLHLLTYDDSDARYAAVQATVNKGEVESIPHLLNFVEWTYEEADFNNRIVFKPDTRPFKYQQIAINAVETLLGETIIGADSHASGSNRSLGGFVTTNGYKDEMKAAILNAQNLLDYKSVNAVIKTPNTTKKSSVFEEETELTVIRKNAPTAPKEEPFRPEHKTEEENRGGQPVFDYLLLGCLLAAGVVLFNLIRR